MSYFRPSKIRKTGPRSICSLPDSTQNLSRKRGWVTAFRIQLRICLEKGVGSPAIVGTACCVFLQVTNQNDGTAMLRRKLRQSVKHRPHFIRAVHVHVASKKTLERVHNNQFGLELTESFFNVRDGIQRDAQFNRLVIFGLHNAPKLKHPYGITTNLQQTWQYRVGGSVFAGQQENVAWCPLFCWLSTVCR